MNTFIIEFIGIVLFVAGSGTGPSDPRVAVLPQHLNNGTHQGKTVHAHVPFIAFDRAKATLNWNGNDLKPAFGASGMEFLALKDGHEITVNAADTSLKVNKSHYDTGGQAVIPRVRAYCPNFEFDPAKPKAATVAVNVGELSGFIDMKQMAYSEWKVNVPDKLIITVKKGSDERKITLAQGARVIIGNSTATFLANATEVIPADQRHHYYVYYKMDKNANNACTARPSDTVKSMSLHAHALAPQHAPAKRDRKAKPQKNAPVAALSERDRDTDADCSNSNYP